MEDWKPIRYREFYDVPRIFIVDVKGRTLLFDCAFDAEKDDYEELYQVHLLPRLTANELTGSWVDLPKRAVRHLGELRIDTVQFDATRRQFINVAALPPFLWSST